MKHRFQWAAAVAVVLCISGLAAHAQLQHGAAAQAWEYIEVGLDARQEATPVLNKYGAQGWELVGVTSGCLSSASGVGTCGYWAYFKRPR